MGAYNHEHENRRLNEPGITNAASSVEDNIWGLIAERTGDFHPFTIEIDGDVDSAPGYEHRGDLTKSYKRSEKAAAETENLVDRYKIETAGYEEAKKLFFELPCCSTILLLSPAPEEIPEEFREQGYEGQNMAYFYHILPGEDENRRVIKSLTWSNYFDLKDQAEILNHFLDKNKVEESEESILLNPVGACVFTQDTQSLKFLWSKIEDVYAQKDRIFILPPYKLVEEYLLNGRELQKNKHIALSIMIDEIARLKAEGISDEDLEKKWAMMLNLADKELLHKDITKQRFQTDYAYEGRGDFHEGHGINAEEVFAYYQSLNYEPRKAVSHCGTSGGIDSTGQSSTLFTTRTFEAEKTENAQPSVSEGGEKKLCCTCPLCDKKVEAVIKNGRIYCPNCKESREWKEE